MGTTNESGLPVSWGGERGENIRWKVKLPGIGDNSEPDLNQSSPIVWEGCVFVTTAAWPKGLDHHEYPEHHVACYRTNDGEQLWTAQVAPGPWKLGDLRGGYAAPTPATDGQRLYVLFGSGVIAAFDFAGKLLWRHELADTQAFDVAISSSPIVYRDTVIVLADKTDHKSVLLAFDGRQGNVRWEEKRPRAGFNHSTPVVINLGGRPEMLVAASYALEGIDPDNGHVRWWCETPGDVCSPTVASESIYTDSGRGGPGVLVKPQGEGDLTGNAIQWRIGNIPEGLSSPCIAGEYLYRLHTPAVLKCFKMTDGKEAYATRLEGVSTSSSPIATPEGNVYLASAGKSFVIRGGPKFDLIATNELGDAGPASPAVSDGRIYLKGRGYLFCIGSK